MVSVLRPGQQRITIPSIGVQTSRRAVSAGGGTVDLIATASTFIFSAMPTTAFYPTNWSINDQSRYGILKFDLSSLAGQTVSAATLTVTTIAGFYSYVTPLLYVYRILPANDVVMSQVTWNVAKTGTNWAGSAGASTANTDFDSVSCGDHPSVPDIAGTPITVTFDANGIADLQTMIVTANRGFLVRTEPLSAYQAALFANEAYATASYRPKLSVTY